MCEPTIEDVFAAGFRDGQQAARRHHTSNYAIDIERLELEDLAMADRFIASGDLAVVVSDCGFVAGYRMMLQVFSGEAA